MGPRHRLTAVLATALAAAVALASPAAAQQQPVAPASPAIEGPLWRVVEYRAEGELARVLPGVTADALFWAGVVSGSGGCVDYASTYELLDDALSVVRPDVGGASCDPLARAVQDAFMAGLARAATWSVDGAELTLLDASGAPLLRFTAAEVPPEVGIASWRLARLVDADGREQPVVGGTPATAEFLPGGRVVGRTGCGAFLGSWQAGGGDLALSDLHARTSDCPGGSDAHAQAERLVDLLADVARFGVTPAGLSLLDGAGTRLLTWVPAPPPRGTIWTPTAVFDDAGEVVVEADRLATTVLVFEGNAASGRTNCHPWQANYRTSGLALTLEGIQVARGRCRPPIVQRSFLQALARVASFVRRGDDLELLDARGRPALRLTPQGPLAGPTWHVTAIDLAPRGQAARLRAPIGANPPSAVFSEDDGLVSGSTGCNDYAADYEASGISIAIRGALPGGRRCRPNLRRQQGRFLAHLAAADTFIVLPGGLQLMAGNRVLLRFELASDD
jgi:heat shock protein HslJ